jgi:hypothetical protein
MEGIQRGEKLITDEKRFYHYIFLYIFLKNTKLKKYRNIIFLNSRCVGLARACTKHVSIKMG